MASVITPSPNDSADLDPSDQRDEIRAHEREKLRISQFDIVTSLFMALILFLGAFVMMLFIVWLLSGKPRPLPIAPLIENPAGRADNAEGFERDFEPPGAEEVEELQEPTLADTIEAVTDAVSTVAATLTTADTAATASTSGTGKGDSRPPGPEGEGDDIVPRYERWQLNFQANNLRSYARQLDFYHIELGAFGGGIKDIDIAFNLSSAPKKRTVKPKEEKRLYFSWKSATPLQAYDRQLLQQAGIPIAGRNIVRFIPNDVEPPKNLEHVLADIEKKYWESKGYVNVTQIAKTVFESKASGSGYAFEVIEQRYRKNK